MKTCEKNKRGFTLVELSIVLVIIGLIITGVLTGQQIIQNARVTKAVNDIQAYEGQFQTYAQNNGALPGDDSGAATRFTGTTVTSGNGSGSVDGAFNFACTGAAGNAPESCMVWADLRAAGLVKNQSPIAAQPPNPFNGIYGFQDTAFNSTFKSTVLCVSNVPGAAAQAIDTRMDDGSPNGGSLQSMISTGTPGEVSTGTVATSYDSAQSYTLCVRM